MMRPQAHHAAHPASRCSSTAIRLSAPLHACHLGKRPIGKGSAVPGQGSAPSYPHRSSVDSRRRAPVPVRSSSEAIMPEPGPSQTPGSSSSPGVAPTVDSPLPGTVVHHQSNAKDLQNIIASIPYRKILIWSMVVALGYQLTDFFGIVMGTYVISFLGNAFVDWAALRRPTALTLFTPSSWRSATALLFFGAIVSLVTLFGVLTIPDIAREGTVFVNRLQSDNVWVVLVEKMRHGLGDSVMDSIEKAIFLSTSSDIEIAAANVQMGAWRVADMQTGVWTEKRSVQLGMAIASMLKGYTTTAAKITAALLSSVTKFALQILISLVLAFMFIWDMPMISSGVATLKSSRLAPIYNEVAPVLTVFGKLFGRAMEAQARIALVNTLLTAVGLFFLEIPGVGLLSLFVFLCSFIPIAGVIISTVPIGFVALTEYGFFKLLLSIVMVMLVHFVEAYVLNPAIYSAHLKLHPLVVLSVLVFSEHSLGVWGLLLAVPLTVFMLDYCIRYPDSSVTEVGTEMLHSRDGDDYDGRGRSRSSRRSADGIDPKKK